MAVPVDDAATSLFLVKANGARIATPNCLQCHCHEGEGHFKALER